VVRAQDAEDGGAPEIVNTLGARIAALIAAQGPISVSQFMTMALHDPAAGYYATRDPFGLPKQGGGGDFTTAPEISQMFGELLGLWIAQLWLDHGKPRARLVELGPGRGTLMSDALRAIGAAMPEFQDSVEIVLVEASPTLQTIQSEVLAAFALRWTTHFDDTLNDRPLFLLANEFFDALPVNQYVKTKLGWCERMVTLDNAGALTFAVSPVTAPNGFVPSNRAPAPLGAFYETSPSSTALTQQIAEIISQKGGAALIVDYGYGADAGFGETLQAVRAHKFAPILEGPGEADISAHVDFAALSAAARAGGANVFGPIGQCELLTALGIAQRAQRLNQTRERERLTSPDQMGALFKALAIVPKNAPKPAGFS
jgi:NADH dehydrogenase [ubiquinone] 1 alpha subcomplex assembly factor 7